MRELNIQNIKNEIIKIDPKRWWGDDFDIRFYLISKLSNESNKKILDVGGGIGIILSCLNENNYKVNLDISFEDLVKCKNRNKENIQNICGSMTHLPFKEDVFDCVIASNILEVGKENDINTTNNYENNLPTVKKIISETKKVLKKNSLVFFTTPNNEYYKTIKLTHKELKDSILPYFSEFRIFFYNTFPKLHKKSRKLNMANIVPKLMSKIKKNESIIEALCKSHSHNNYSVSFFVEAKKN